MADPWAEFRVAPTVQADQWAEFRAAPAQRGVVDKLLGQTGERYQTWPERAVRDMLTLPQRSVESAASAPAGSRDATEAMVPVATETAMATLPVNPAIRAGDRAIPGVSKALRAEKPIVPTTEELAKVGGAGINAARNSGLDVTASSVGDYARKLQQELYDKGISPVDAPATFTKLKGLEDAPADAFFTAGNLQSLRESLGATAQNFNPQAAKDQLAASRAIAGFDKFLPSIDEASVLAGSPAATQKLFESGRGNYAAGMRSNDLTGALDRANTGIVGRSEGRAQAANSGRNLDNTIRSKVESFLEKPKEVSGYSDAELAALEGVRDGGGVRNTSRYVGNLFGGGGGIGQSGMAAIGAGLGGAGGGIPGAIIGGVVPSVIGAGAKTLANSLAKRSLNKADELVRTRSPLYEERVANPEMSTISPEKRASLLRLLAISQNDPNNQGSIQALARSMMQQ